MSIVDVTSSHPSRTRQMAFVLPVFAASLFLSAFLLFSVQPMFTKMVLPILGGSPSVWSVAMVFFQSALLGGYAYAHFVASRLSLGYGIAIHIAVLTLAALALPISVASGFGAPPSGHTAFWLFGLFAFSVGLPFFAVSTNGPLLQSWFARSDHHHAHDPYFLYGASNIGSFAALLLYPVIFEPFIGAALQSRIWSIGYGAMVLAIAGCGLMVWRSGATTIAAPAATEDASDAPDGWRLLHWTALAFVPSALLVGVTAHLSTDVASAPFLWVLPLALFLATFVIVFQRRPVLSHTSVLRWHPYAVTVLVLVALAGLNIPLPVTATLHLVVFFFSTMLCHGEMVRLRPTSAYLTTFYLVMSAGGALGGLFAGLIAPNVFNSIVEYPMMVAAALLLHPALYASDTSRMKRRALIGLAVFSCIGAPLVVFAGAGMIMLLAFIFAMTITACALIDAESRSMRLKLSVALLLIPSCFSLMGLGGDSVRSFFGVHRIRDIPELDQRQLLHGTTIHGSTRLSDLSAPADVRPLTTGYYTEHGPLHQGLEAARLNGVSDALNLGFVGLGSGTMACHSKPGESWTFFEIDPEVIHFARDPKRFPFLARCAPQAAIELGDARLLLDKRQGKPFDFLMIDAFSSDAIPVHLMTREAMAIYRRNLSEHGSVLFHVSNRHMELASVVAAIAASEGMVAYWRHDRRLPDATNPLRYPSIAVITARSDADLAAIAANPEWTKLKVPADSKPWTDDHANVLAAIWRKYRAE